MKFQSNQRSRREHGYVLLTLLLFVALLSIGSMAAIERIDFQIRRDREEELIHRGSQYSRAIRRYVKKFGRFPTSVEELENTDNIRFLRKRYKDPITGKDFKLLYAANPPQAPITAPGPANAKAASQSQNAAGDGSDAPTEAQESVDNVQSDGNDQGGPTPADGDASSATDPAASGSKSGKASTNDEQPTFGGPPILGVASLSKDKSIREFNKKDHYDEWQFMYDPATDRGGLLTTPSQPALQGAVQPDK
jgi:type II secretory pathway pseudopilin PulG